MSFVGVGIGVGGLATLGGSIIGANAAGSAADKQAGAAAYAADVQKQMFDRQVKNAEPWRLGGIQSLYGPGGLFVRKDPTGTGNGGGQLQTDWISNRLQALKNERQHQFESIEEEDQGRTDEMRRQLMARQSDDVLARQAASDWGTLGVKETEGQIDPSLYQIDPELTRKFTMADFQADPGYDFRMKEGEKALTRSAAAKGKLEGGGFLKALTRYGQDYASNEYDRAWNRFGADQTNRFNKLSTLAGLGQTSSAQVGQAGQNYGNQMAEIAMQNANAQGAAGIAGANAWSSGLQGLGGMGKTWMDYTLANKYLGMLGGGDGGGGGGMSPVAAGYGRMVR